MDLLLVLTEHMAFLLHIVLIFVACILNDLSLRLLLQCSLGSVLSVEHVSKPVVKVIKFAHSLRCEGRFVLECRTFSAVANALSGSRDGPQSIILWFLSFDLQLRLGEWSFEQLFGLLFSHLDPLLSFLFLQL